MKRSILFKAGIAALLSFSFILVACNKDEVSGVYTGTNGVGACSEQSTRTAVDQTNSLMWVMGDKIGFFDEAGYGLVNMELTATELRNNNYWAWFENDQMPELDPAAGDYYAYYPYGEASLNGGKFTLTAPSRQVYAGSLNGIVNDYFPMVAFQGQSAQAESVDVDFKNIFSIIKLDLYCSTPATTLRSVTFSSNDGGTVSGRYTADARNYDVEFLPGGGSVIVLDLEGGVILSESDTSPTTLYMVVPPLAFNAGFTLTFNTDKGIYSEGVGETGITLARNTLYSPDPLRIIPDGTARTDLNSPNQWNMTGTEPIYANSYVVTAASGYFFDATVAGNGPAGMEGVCTAFGKTLEELRFEPSSTVIAPTYAQVLWQTSQNLIRNVSISGGIVSFETGTGSGNAVIAVYDRAPSNSGTILWSWHIWVTDADFYLTAENTDTYNGYEAMDRNLGATSGTPADNADTYGLYYQWGRKDPYLDKNAAIYGAITQFGAVGYGTNLTIGLTIANPHLAIPGSNNWLPSNKSSVYLWGSPSVDEQTEIKTVYDPCPVGYRVPSSKIWDSFTTGWNYGGNTGWDNNTKGLAHGRKNGQQIVDVVAWYPASKFLTVWGSIPEFTTYGNGCYSATPRNEQYAHGLFYTESTCTLQHSSPKTCCFAVRCVKE